MSALGREPLEKNEGWTSGLTDVLGGIVKTVKDMVVSTEESVVTAVKDVKNAFIGDANEEKQEGAKPEKSNKRRSRSGHKQQAQQRRKVNVDTEAEPLSGMERLTRAKRNSASHKAIASSPAVESSGASEEPREAGVKRDGASLQPGARIEALTGRSPAHHVQKLTEKSSAVYIERVQPKHKHDTKAFPSTYHHPTPTKEKHTSNPSSVRRQAGIQFQPVSRSMAQAM